MIGLLLLVLTVAGCTGLPMYSSMSPEQIHEFGKIKDANITCIDGTYAGAKVTTVYVNADRGVGANVTIADNCKVTLTTPGTIVPK